MTANAIYSYFPTRDDLVTALIDDLYTSLAEALEAARDAQPADDPARRILAWAEAFRSWSLANPCGFRLVYGDPVPGYRPPPGGPAPGAHRRVLAALAELTAAVGPGGGAGNGDPDAVDLDGYAWSDFDAGLVATARRGDPELRPAAVASALRIWARLHGLVAFEVYGHLGAEAAVAGRLYRTEVDSLLRSLGYAPPP